MASAGPRRRTSCSSSGGFPTRRFANPDDEPITVRKILAPAALALAAACAPAARSTAPADAPRQASADSARRWNLRPVPTSEAFRRGLAAGTRTANGAPGPRYWQQAVRYRIRAELDPASTLLRGSERIVYHNRSPDTLPAIVLNLYQNIYSESVPRNRRAPNTGGVTLDRVVAQGAALAEQPPARIGVMRQAERPAAGYAVEGTLARLMLPRPLAPGDSAVLEIDWHHKVPPAPTFRTAWEDALGARAFVVGQWYPQVATYDDVNGWDATPYLGDGEFYLEYGDFEVDLTLPAGWIVGATGTLVNAAEVLAPETRRRLERVASSDSVVHVVTAADLTSGAALARASDGRLTWRFAARNVRDFAFATSDHYLWDAARATVPGATGGERAIPIHALYRPGAAGWDRAWRYGQHAIGYLSRLITPYVYDQATIAEGLIAGMDEGVNSFYEDRAIENFFPGTPPGGSVNSYLRVAGHDAEVPLMRHTDLVSPYGQRTVAAYTKPAAVLLALRGVLGDSVYNRAIREYVRAWSFRHPQPWDFFNTFERVAGRDLDWFWYPWFFETGVLDQSVESVRAVEGGVEVVVRDRGDNPMPSFVSVTTGNGTVTEQEVEIEGWIGGRGARTATLLVPTYGGAATRVEIDPRHVFPDVDRANNVWAPRAP
jgi:hypothetical protein